MSTSRSPPTSLITSETVVRVSSTLDKSVGKKYLTDGSNETCWASANGLPQSLTLIFPRPVTPSRIVLTFAGGFVGTVCTLCHTLPSLPDTPKEKEWNERNRFFPEDVNRRQTFELVSPRAEGEGGVAEEEGQREWRVVFEKGSDFFGRITVYEIELWGSEVEGQSG